VTTSTRITRVAAAAFAFALLVGCSSSGSDDAATTTTEVEATTTTEEATTTTTTEEEETTTTEAGDDDPASQLATFLITADDLGPSFVEMEASASESGPCGVSVDEEFPPAVKAQTAFQSEELQLAMQHDLRVFASEDDASAAFDGFVDSVSCGSETTNSSIELGEPTDVTDEVGQKAVAVAITGDGVEGVGVVVHYSDLVATYQFQGATGAAEASGIASPLDITAGNIQDIVDQIG
jgi:hypothetical protein